MIDFHKNKFSLQILQFKWLGRIENHHRRDQQSELYSLERNDLREEEKESGNVIKSHCVITKLLDILPENIYTCKKEMCLRRWIFCNIEL